MCLSSFFIFTNLTHGLYIILPNICFNFSFFWCKSKYANLIIQSSLYLYELYANVFVTNKEVNQNVWYSRPYLNLIVIILIWIILETYLNTKWDQFSFGLSYLRCQDARKNPTLVLIRSFRRAIVGGTQKFPGQLKAVLLVAHWLERWCASLATQVWYLACPA